MPERLVGIAVDRCSGAVIFELEMKSVGLCVPSSLSSFKVLLTAIENSPVSGEELPVEGEEKVLSVEL